MPPVKRVAVIGAGPGGAIATDALVKEQAFDVIRVFDRRPVIGGSWVYTPHLPAQIPSLRELLAGDADKPVPLPPAFPAETPKSEAVNSHQRRFSDTALHANLHTNIVPSLMSFTQEPLPDVLSDTVRARYGPDAPFRHHTVVREWVEGIFVRGGHLARVELSTTVERAEKRDGEWLLTLRRELPGSDYWWQEKFDALVVATGHYNVPWFPPVPGLLEYDERFPGRISHSKHFRGPQPFKDKNVLVVGGSISSHEVLHEILPHARHPVHAAVREPIPAFGWEPFRHPHIRVHKALKRLDPATGAVEFADGERIDGLDRIVFGTGYTFSLPFLPHVQERIRRADRRLPGVYMHTWDIVDPTLAFVGMLGGGFTFRVYEWQAVAVARRLAGRAARPLPPLAEQRAWERDRVARFGGGKPYYSIAPHYKEVFEFFRGIAGEPAPGTTGRRLPPFDDAWLKVWADMVATKLRGFEQERKRAEAEEEEEKKKRGGDEPARAKL